MDRSERAARVAAQLERSSLDGLICVLPSNVLMLSGYWPVVGLSVALATRAGIRLLVPKDESELAKAGWAGEVAQYEPGSLREQLDPIRALEGPLRDQIAGAGLEKGRIGYETGSIFEGSSYSATYRFLGNLRPLIERAVPGINLVPAAEAIAALRFSLTAHEAGRVRLACNLAAESFGAARAAIEPGRSEAEVATALSASFQVSALQTASVTRAGAFAWCMSGPNSAKAGGAFARTTDRRLDRGDLVLVHSNPYVDGYFADITRTYVLGSPNPHVGEMFEALLAAREAALATLGPGVRAAEADRAARQVIEKAGYGSNFTHGLGHSVGFSVISAELPPRLNPTSPDVLEPGCTFNVEPATYIEGEGGIRHCDVITITESGYELLTPFHSTLDDLVVESG